MSNDVIILSQILSQKKAEDAPTLSESAYFEIFSASQILKDYDLSYDEIESGIVGDGGDGGLDSIYVFLNGDLVEEDTDTTVHKRNIEIELVFIQSKTSSGFSEQAMDKFHAATEDLLDLSKPLDSLTGVYNAAVLGTLGRFRDLYTKLVTKSPSLLLSYYFATKGTEVHPNVQRKVDRLRDRVSQLFSAAKFTFTFVTAGTLVALNWRHPKTSYELAVTETISSKRAAQSAFVCLVSLRDFFRFMADSQGHLLRHLFESNVRDYEGGSIEVNEQIRTSLNEKNNPEDFWWLNNGVSILASKPTLSGKTLTLEDPQIVNGLQTSTELHKYFQSQNTDKDDRAILVRVIEPSDSASRDRIIKATNSQTKISAASLRATEKIHRDIEEFFQAHGLYYDRRKNFHKNEGKPIEKIVSIPFLAQSVMAIALQRPDSARARPSSLLKKDDDYKRIFDEGHPVELYVTCARVMKSVDAFIHSPAAAVDGKAQTNLRFYVAMDVSATVLNKAKPSANDLKSISVDNVAMKASLDRVAKLYVEMGASDQLAKGPDLVARLASDLKARFPLIALAPAAKEKG